MLVGCTVRLLKQLALHSNRLFFSMSYLVRDEYWIRFFVGSLLFPITLYLLLDAQNLFNNLLESLYDNVNI